ncbi:hypothetical protein CERSUDRAFT_114525 [Gelatoporia subvermispora B]|uniref:Uncharacterized protein n=1 Tax=Ceriporiopsis subvermispora (strain B) TaxID=914234 RepID=M2PN72_CERS8|nr:hypothetical protein CERSUDRAFT_114525 [Gelatoporia subvermispora B]
MNADGLQLLAHAALVQQGVHDAHLSTCPISRIPPEVLSDIFKQYATSVLHTPKGPGPLPPSYVLQPQVFQNMLVPDCGYAWTKVIEVCHHWRKVALSTPRLWNDILVTNPEWMEKVLSRTAQVPLHVCARLAYDRTRVDALKLVLRETHRVADLKILALDKWAGELAANLRDLPIPLTSLQLEWDGLSMIDGPGIDISQLSLHSRSPQLRHVRIENCPFMTWTSSILCPTVTTLVWKYPTDSGVTVNVSEILSALRNMPSLESIDLSNVVPNRALEDEALWADVVPLPRFYTFMIRGDKLRSETCVALLHNIHSPVVSSAHLMCGSIETASGLVGPFSAFLRNPPQIYAFSVKLTGFFLEICAWSSRVAEQFLEDVSTAPELFAALDPGFVHHSNQFDPDFHLKIRGGDMRSLGMDVLWDICRGVPLSGVRALRVQSEIPSPEQLRELFAMMDGIALLDVWDLQSPTLVNVLQSRAAPPEDESAGSFVLPRLQILEFDGCSLWQGPAQASPGPDAMDCLLSTLESRRAAGAQVRKLVLSECIVATTAQLDAAAQIVNEVEYYDIHTRDSDVPYNFRKFRYQERHLDEYGRLNLRNGDLLCVPEISYT